MTQRRKINLPLLEVIGVSVVIHVIAIFVLGGLTIWQMVQEAEPEFEAPEIPSESVEPKQLKVRIEKATKKSAQPRQVIKVTVASDINPPDHDIMLPQVDNRVAVGTNVGGGGLGRNWGNDGLDLGKSAVNFFGIKSSGENIVFVVDVAKSMLEPSRGDVWGFNRVKEEIGTMIDQLSAGTLFNIYTYAQGLDVFSTHPIAATDANKEKAKEWFNRYWAYDGPRIVGHQGTRLNNYKPEFTDAMPIRREVYREKLADNGATTVELQSLPPERWGSGTSRLDLALLAAFENRADTIFVITDGTPLVRRTINEREFSQFAKTFSKWDAERRAKAGVWEDFQQRWREYREKVAAYQEERRKKGLPPEIREGGRIGGIAPPEPPSGIGYKPVHDPKLSIEQLNKMLKQRARELYGKLDRKPPPLHIVGYGTNDKQEDQLKDLQSGFSSSKFRMITGKDLKSPEEESSSS